MFQEKGRLLKAAISEGGKLSTLEFLTNIYFCFRRLVLIPHRDDSHCSLIPAANASQQQWSVHVGFASVSFHVHRSPASKNCRSYDTI